MAERGDLALVMSGGGARAAYQVGLLRFLARRMPGFEAPILTGVSAGAINTAFLAAHPWPFRERVASLESLWNHLEVENVFHTGVFGLFQNAVRWGASLALGGHGPRSRRGMVDTAPLRDLLHRELGAEQGELTGVEVNLERSRLRAVALTTSSYTTGQSVTWVQGSDIPAWQRAHRRSRPCRLRVEHVLASASLPLFFPAVEIGGAWYGDGGMRLTAPLSPAVHLGAQRILAISTRYRRSVKEADAAVVDGYPPPAQVAGVVLNAIFLDQFEADALRLERINHLVERVPAGERGDLRPIELLVLRPSRDLGHLANEYEPDLPRSFRFFTRGLGTKETRSNDFLSLVMFQGDYLRRLIDLGEEDAEARADEILAFLR
ncbi:MAG: patatin-like phospholipase family protein [Planctomycetota bacterium]|nr:patatin-like phospholipase family protein [Planctomycetota bacterium]